MILLKYVISLVLTILTECAAAEVIAKKRETVRFVFLVNLITNPPANLFFNALLPLVNKKAVLIAVIETAVVLSEAFLFYKYSNGSGGDRKHYGFVKCLGISLALNAFSYFTGLAVNSVVRV